MIARRLAAAALAALVPLAAVAQARFTDDGGRTVALPQTVGRVVPAGPPASVDLLAVAPGKLVGLTRALEPEAAAFLPADAAALPALGRLTTRTNPMALDVLKKALPALIVDVGDVDAGYIALADRVQQAGGVPYVLIAGRLAEAPATLRKLGTVTGEGERAETLARYAEETLALVRARVAQVPPAARPTIYIGRGPKGLETGVAASINTEAIELLGARNAATAEPGGRGLRQVTLDDLLGWQPDVILVLEAEALAEFGRDPRWRQLRAVEQGRVFHPPARPFGWVDEPPAVNQLIGLRWLGSVLYPALFPEDIRAEARRYYALFYRREPSAAELDRLLAGATPPG